MQHKQDLLLLWCACISYWDRELSDSVHFKTGYVALIVGSTLSLIQEEIDNYPFIENQVLYFKIRCVGFIGLIRCEKDLRIAHLFKLDAFQSNLRLWNGQLEWKLIWPIYFITFHHPLNKHYMDLISFGLFFKCSPEGELQQGLFFSFLFLVLHPRGLGSKKEPTCTRESNPPTQVERKSATWEMSLHKQKEVIDLEFESRAAR